MVLMVRPHKFRMNELTAINNYYQQRSSDKQREQEAVTKEALHEFDSMVSRKNSVFKDRLRFSVAEVRCEVFQSENRN